MVRDAGKPRLDQPREIADIAQRFQFGRSELDPEAHFRCHDEGYMGLAVPAVDVVGGRLRAEAEGIVIEYVAEHSRQLLEDLLFVHDSLSTVISRLESN